MQGGKNWILPKEINANRFFRGPHWLEMWKNHLCPSIRPNGGSVAMDSASVNYIVELYTYSSGHYLKFIFVIALLWTTLLKADHHVHTNID